MSTDRRIQQGDIYWLSDDVTSLRHPHVVVQPDVFNLSRLDTVIVCALTTNLKRVSMPGNVLLEANEADLEKQSVVEVAKITSVKKADLGDYIGRLSQARVAQILAGLQFLQNMGY